MLYLDHLIWTGNNIEEISRQYGVSFAVKSVKGGDHESWGTFNYLTHLSNNCYLEWLGVDDMEKAKQLDHPLIKHLVYALENNQQGPFQFALRTDKMNEYVEHFKKNNISFTGPLNGKRNQPNGDPLTWRMLFPHCDYENGCVLPFLIQWDQPEKERIDVSLINHQAITDIYFSGTSKEHFTKIFNLPNKKRNNKVTLRNTVIHFTEENPLLQMKLT